jgi:hypothetical protein
MAQSTSFRASQDLRPLDLDLTPLVIEELKNKVKTLPKETLSSEELRRIDEALIEISSVFTTVLEKNTPKVIEKINEIVERDLKETQTVVNIVQEAFSTFTKSISLEANFNAFIGKDVVIKASSEVKIQHFLGVIPKWRIILRQVGNGVVTDVASGWNETYITLKNNGIEDVTISVFIARE